MAKLNKAEYTISVNTDEMYSGKNEVSVKLIIDYDSKVYEIIPGIIRSQTQCKVALFISEAIKLAYEKAMTELYGDNK